MAEAYDASAELRRIVEEGRISEEALQAITGIQVGRIRSFLRGVEQGMRRVTAGAAPPPLSSDETARLALLTAQLTDGLPIDDDDDERLRAVFESLTIECRLTLQNLSALTGLAVDDIEGVLRDPRTLPPATKYELASRGGYLINAFNRARGG